MTDLEASFDYFWRVLGGPELAPEYKFDVSRGWKADRAHIPARVLVEIEGGTWKPGGGRHNRAAGYAEDCVKYNAAQAAGWLVFRLTADMLTGAPAEHLTPIMATIEARMQVDPVFAFWDNPLDAGYDA